MNITDEQLAVWERGNVGLMVHELIAALREERKARDANDLYHGQRIATAENELHAAHARIAELEVALEFYARVDCVEGGQQ